MDNKWRDQAAVGLGFTDILEITLRREECVRERISKMAFEKLQNKYPNIDYRHDYNVTIHSISADCGEVEVVFNIEEKQDDVS